MKCLRLEIYAKSFSFWYASRSKEMLRYAFLLLLYLYSLQSHSATYSQRNTGKKSNAQNPNPDKYAISAKAIPTGNSSFCRSPCICSWLLTVVLYLPAAAFLTKINGYRVIAKYPLNGISLLNTTILFILRYVLLRT